MKPATIDLDGIEMSWGAVEMFLSKISYGNARGGCSLLAVLVFVEKCPFVVGAGDVGRRFNVGLKCARSAIHTLIELGLVREYKNKPNRFRTTERGRGVARHHGHPTAWARVLEDD
jgi:hypothetical protein